jgi:hypothetical protein
MLSPEPLGLGGVPHGDAEQTENGAMPPPIAGVRGGAPFPPPIALAPPNSAPIPAPMGVPPPPPAGNGELPHGLEQYMRDAIELPPAPPLPHEPDPVLPPPQQPAGDMLPPIESQFEPNPIVAALSDPPPSVQPPAAHPPPREPHAPPPRAAAPPPKPRKQPPMPDFAGLPPAMAESLAKLAGVPWPPRADAAHDSRELEDQAAGSGPRKDEVCGAPRRRLLHA